MNRPASRPGRAYLIRFAAGMGSYAVLLPLALWLARGPLQDSPARFPLVLALLAPSMLVIVWAVWRFTRDADELQSRMLVESLAMAFAGGSVVTFSWGLLQSVGAPAVDWLWVMPVYMVCWLIATAVVRGRY